MKGKILYRYDDSGGTFECRKYQVVRETPGGFWLEEISSLFQLTHKTWRSKRAKYPYALPTRYEAARAYSKRKQHHAAILEGKLMTVNSIRRQITVHIRDNLMNKENCRHFADPNEGLQCAARNCPCDLFSPCEDEE